MLNIENRDSVAWLTIDRAETRNAIAGNEWNVLRDLLGEFEQSQQRVLVITGANGDFCAGADLSNLGGDRGRGVAASRQTMKQVDAAASALRSLTKPTIAAVEGVAAGAGMNLALGCDVVVASATARFTEIFVKRGLILDFGGTWLLPRHVGLQRAKELAFSGRIVDGAEAAEIGLALEVVAPGDLISRTTELAATFASGAPIAQMFTKAALERGLSSTFEEALAYEALAQSVCLNSEDVVEGVRSFLEKRPPEFTGR